MKAISTVVLAAAILAVLGPRLSQAADTGGQAPAAAAAAPPATQPAAQPAAGAAAEEDEDEAEPSIDGWEKVKLDPHLPMGKVDADAAITLARNNGCFRCHAIDRVKTGPAFKSVAQAYRGNLVGGYKREYAHLTAGDMFVFAGNVDHHRVLRTDPPNDPAQLKNLIDWIFSLDDAKK